MLAHPVGEEREVAGVFSSVLRERSAAMSERDVAIAAAIRSPCVAGVPLRGQGENR
jgi:hypothetical protein